MPIGSGNRVLDALVALLFVVGVGVGVHYVTPASVKGQWHESVDDAMDASDQSGKPILLFFTADWCPACEHFKQNTLSVPDVRNGLHANFELVRIDLSDRSGPNVQVAHEFNITTIPRLVVYSADGRYIDDASAMSADALEGWLASCLEQAGP